MVLCVYALVDTSLVFWKPEVSVGERAAFQLSLSAPSSVSMTSLPFSSLAIHFSPEMQPIVVKHKHDESQMSSPAVRRVDVGHVFTTGVGGDAIEVEADLRWGPGSTIVFAGDLSSNVPAILKVRTEATILCAFPECISFQVSKLLLTLNEGNWCIEIPLQPDSFRRSTPTPSRWLVSSDPPRFVPVRREHCSTVACVTTSSQ